MLWAILGSVVAHHGDAVDPVLLEWIKDRLDHLLGLGPWTVVALAGLFIVALPIGLVLLYVVQKRETGSEPYQATVDEP